MSIPAAGQKRLVIVGATGMVGGYALRYALDDLAVGSVTAIVRKKLGISHTKLVEVLHQDFADCSPLAEALSGQDAAVFCLGAYTGAVPDAKLRTITVDYTIEFARVFRGGSPEASFSFLSGNGAPAGATGMVGGYALCYALVDWLIPVMTERAPPASRRRAGVPQTATSRRS